MNERRIIDYHILTADTPDELIKLVHHDMGKLTDFDWFPIGGVSVALSESDDYRYVVYAQAMARYELPK